jgi:hypothetical protein
MKITRFFLAASLLVGSSGVTSAFAAAPGVISNQVLIPGRYCHLTFPAVREETLAGNHPVLKDPSSGDIIDFYGPCDQDPLGKDEIELQEQQVGRVWSRP